ncbi:hypothetical protein LXA43DRAFT_1095875 [Ganoderma leucocontextum]|nr:hypothetical protein LXA43DRAFT_1095875 [Ganoderma leucocontextum]
MSSPRVWFSKSHNIPPLPHPKTVDTSISQSPARPPALDAAQYSFDHLLVVKVDITQRQDITDAFAKANDTFGRIDVVVNNAAIVVMGGVQAHEEGPMRELFETNFWSAAKGGPVLQGGEQTHWGTFTPGFVDHGSHWRTWTCLLFRIEARYDKDSCVHSWSFSTHHHGTLKYVPADTRIAMYHRSTPTNPTGYAHQSGWLPYRGPGEDDLGAVAPRETVNKAVEVIYRLASEPDPPLRLLLGDSAHTYLKQKIARLTADVEKYASWSENLKKDGL